MLDLLTHLVEKSLVLYEEETGRYRLLETVCQYARERQLEAGEGEAVRGRHLEFFLKLAEAGAEQLKGEEPRQWLDRVEVEHDNLRAALEWSIPRQDRGEECLRLAVASEPFWVMRGYHREGWDWLTRVLPRRDGAPASLRARVLCSGGWLAYWHPERYYAAAQALLEESLATARDVGDKELLAETLFQLGRVTMDFAGEGAAKPLLEEALRLRRELEDTRGVGWTLCELGRVAQRQNDLVHARELFADGLMLLRKTGDKLGVGAALWGTASVATEQGEITIARSLLEDSLALRRDLEDRIGIARTLRDLGELALGEGDYAAARPWIEESFALYHGIGDRTTLGHLLNDLLCPQSHSKDEGMCRSAIVVRLEGTSKVVPSASTTRRC